MDRNVVRERFKTPEGRYELVAQKTTGIIPFHYQRSTRLTFACMGPTHTEDKHYVLYNVADLLHVSQVNSTHMEPLRSITISSAGGRSTISCHHFQATTSKDGLDTLVGVADGSVHILSLAAHLNKPVKPGAGANLTPEPGVDAKCVAVTWLPKTEGMFVAGFASGNIYLYKKSSILGEASGRFSLNIGSSKQSTTPHAAWTVCKQGIHDVAASPCGTRLAVACADGVLRIVDVASGAVTGGCASYYGALLCCSFSPDGRYVAAAGEDDLVCVYSVQERWPVVHCEGHDSWVTRVQWDPQMQLGGLTPGSPSSLAGHEATRLYRLATVGQDAQLCLWDVQVCPGDGDLMMLPTNSTSMRKSNSNLTLGSPNRGSSDLTIPGGAGGGGHQRKPSIGKANGGGPVGTIVPSLPHADMNIVQPTMQHRIHLEPLSDILFTDSYVLTADHTGCIRTWRRPAPLTRISMQRAALLSAAATGPQNMDTS